MLIALAIVLVLSFLVPFVLARRARPHLRIAEPSLGVLNLSGDVGDAEASVDLPLLAPLFREVRHSNAAPPVCDVLLLYCRIDETGNVADSTRTIRQIIRDSAAPIVVMGSSHPISNYIAAAANPAFGKANLVLTLDRHGDALASFMAKVFGLMHTGITMPDAWQRTATPNRNDSRPLPDTVFSCELGRVSFIP